MSPSIHAALQNMMMRFLTCLCEERLTAGQDLGSCAFPTHYLLIIWQSLSRGLRMIWMLPFISQGSLVLHGNANSHTSETRQEIVLESIQTLFKSMGKVSSQFTKANFFGEVSKDTVVKEAVK